MWLVILGFALGLIMGYFAPFSIPIQFSQYLAVAILAGLDSCLGGVNAGFTGSFKFAVFLSGFTFNILIATILVYFGDLIGIDLYLAAIVVFGVRIFSNATVIRLSFFSKQINLDKNHNKEKYLEDFSTSEKMKIITKIQHKVK